VTLNGSKQYLHFYSTGEDSFVGGNAINIMTIHGENTGEFSLSKQSFVVDGTYNWNKSIEEIFVEENGALTIQGIMYDQGASLTLTEEVQNPYEFLQNLIFDKTYRNSNGGEFELAISEGENNTGVVEYSEYGNLVKTGTFSIATLKQYGYMDVLYTGDVEATRYTFHGAGEWMDENEEGWIEYTDPDPYGLNMIASNSVYSDGNGHILSFENGQICLQNLEDENNPIVEYGWPHGEGFVDGVDLEVVMDNGFMIIEFAQDGQTCQIIYYEDNEGEVDLSGYGEFAIQAQEPPVIEEPAGWNDEHQLLDILRSNTYTNGAETIQMVFDGTYYTANLIVLADDSYSMYGMNVLIDGYDITIEDGKTGTTKTGTISADGLTVTFTGEETFTAIV
jgi:hypothetical protein